MLKQYIVTEIIKDRSSILINSQIDLLRSQTALIKDNARFPILEIAKAIPVSRKSVLTFTLRILTSHDEKFMNYSG